MRWRPDLLRSSYRQRRFVLRKTPDLTRLSDMSGNATNQELDASTLGVIEDTARLDESYTPIPLKHLASCQIEGSR
jgi:hypothetical protein